jgi:hypothetical protein
MNLTFDYSVKSEPELIQDAGKGDGWITDLTINIRANPTVSEEGAFQVKIDFIELDVRDFDLVLTGNDISMLVNFFSEQIKSIIKQSLLGVLK